MHDIKAKKIQNQTPGIMCLWRHAFLNPIRKSFARYPTHMASQNIHIAVISELVLIPDKFGDFRLKAMRYIQTVISYTHRRSSTRNRLAIYKVRFASSRSLDFHMNSKIPRQPASYANQGN